MIGVTSEETVARRIVMRSDTWERLVLLAELLQESRDVEVSPTDVAVIALEAGLQEVQRGASGKFERRTPSGRSRRPAPRLRLTPEDREQLSAWLAGERSRRARQRTIALWLGLRRRKVHQELLRDLAVEHGAYDVANFAQNMKKDGALFAELSDEEGRRVGWRLTRAGAAAARALEERALLLR